MTQHKGCFRHPLCGQRQFEVWGWDCLCLAAFKDDLTQQGLHPAAAEITQIICVLLQLEDSFQGNNTSYHASVSLCGVTIFTGNKKKDRELAVSEQIQEVKSWSIKPFKFWLIYTGFIWFR